MKTKKKAIATRVDGDVYNVDYPNTSDYDRNVSGDYLIGLVRSGFEVTVQQRCYRGEGEPASYILRDE